MFEMLIGALIMLVGVIFGAALSERKAKAGADG